MKDHNYIFIIAQEHWCIYRREQEVLLKPLAHIWYEPHQNDTSCPRVKWKFSESAEPE